MNKGYKHNQWHQMRNNDVPQPFKSVCTINDRTFQGVIIHRLQTGIKYHKGKWGDMPYPVEHHHQFNCPGLGEHGDIHFQPPFKEGCQNPITNKQPSYGESSNDWRYYEWKERDENNLASEPLSKIIHGQGN